jgi:hypothetical protein
MIKKIIKEHLLLEKKIADIRANLIISYDLRHDERSSHSEKRKWRHVSTGGDRIYDLYIQNLVEAAKDEITFRIVQEEIQDGVRFIVSQKSDPHLNVIIEPKMKNPYIWTLYVISVMNKKDFAIGRDQLQIFA